MTERVAFLMKDFVLLAVSVYLLKQDLLRVSIGQPQSSGVAFQIDKAGAGARGRARTQAIPQMGRSRSV